MKARRVCGKEARGILGSHGHDWDFSQPLLQRTAQKRIALPVGVEPKVFFPNERTFLSWLRFTVVLGGLSVGLLNFGDKVGKISAGMFSFIAMAIMVYALVTHHCRASAIRRRDAGPYDDRFGLTVLCVFLPGVQMWSQYIYDRQSRSTAIDLDWENLANPYYQLACSSHAFRCPLCSQDAQESPYR
ncbi:hypothetical protein BS47DRAFT_660584 [Hydnum rufescens UP504]|uniref:DUF202 domain-containing protein n=1 Tax=Hydnum rufescens UP504 TaxID=1448309 RepID=A0A9P6AEX3_9AGAM|nr:hypothetical protein BS47DRAFT_660584 [Hydnum rufescens UP504]